MGGTQEGKLNKYLRLEQMGLQLGWMLAVYGLTCVSEIHVLKCFQCDCIWRWNLKDSNQGSVRL